MSKDCVPYIEQSPGDLITSESWNEMQCLIQDDIETKTQEAVDGIQSVPEAGDSQKLDGKTADELTDEIVERAVAEVRDRRGYLSAFKILRFGEDRVIRHKFGAWPGVDVYQLDYFKVVCCEDDDTYKSWVTFYLYHSSEKKIRCKSADGTSENIEIEPKDGPVYKIKFKDMLNRYKVKFSGQSSLGDLETEFWKAFFGNPNDEFDDEQYCHSPWFEKCCRQERTVKELKSKGDWNDMWFLVKPRKTINYPSTLPSTGDTDGGIDWGWLYLNLNLGPEASPAPTQVQVCQYDLDRVGLRLLASPAYPDGHLEELQEQYGDELGQELKVMVILKC